MLKIYSCPLCHLSNTTKQHYKVHCTTQKHLYNMNIKNKIPILYDESYIFSCHNCNKKYKSNKGLWQHKKKCIPTPVAHTEPNNKNEIDTLLQKCSHDDKQYILQSIQE